MCDASKKWKTLSFTSDFFFCIGDLSVTLSGFTAEIYEISHKQLTALYLMVTDKATFITIKAPISAIL